MKYYSEKLLRLFDSEDELFKAELEASEANTATNKKKSESYVGETLEAIEAKIEDAKDELEEAYQFYKNKLHDADLEVKKLYDECEDKAAGIYDKLIEEGTPKITEANKKIQELKEKRYNLLSTKAALPRKQKKSSFCEDKKPTAFKDDRISYKEACDLLDEFIKNL